MFLLFLITVIVIASMFKRAVHVQKSIGKQIVHKEPVNARRAIYFNSSDYLKTATLAEAQEVNQNDPVKEQASNTQNIDQYPEETPKPGSNDVSYYPDNSSEAAEVAYSDQSYDSMSPDDAYHSFSVTVEVIET